MVSTVARRITCIRAHCAQFAHHVLADLAPIPAVHGLAGVKTALGAAALAREARGFVPHKSQRCGSVLRLERDSAAGAVDGLNHAVDGVLARRQRQDIRRRGDQQSYRDREENESWFHRRSGIGFVQRVAGEALAGRAAGDLLAATTSTAFGVTNGFGIRSVAAGSSTHCPSTTKRYS